MNDRPACPFCTSTLKVLLESPRWRLVRHADPVAIAGWMMIVTREHRAGPDELDPSESAELGFVIRAVAAAVRAQTGCERTYLLSFNEAVPHLHVHVIPRHAADGSTTSWALADRYRAVARGDVPAAASAEANEVAEAIATRALEALKELGFASPQPAARPEDA
ncbi:MAG: hypothetical protein RLZZ238_2430 [Planctomycetota bacterium]